MQSVRKLGWARGSGVLDDTIRSVTTALCAAERDPRWTALAVISGAVYVYQQAEPPALAVVAALLGLCLYRFAGRALVVFFLIALAWASFWAQQQLDTRLPTARSGEVVWVTGHVAGLASRESFRTRFELVRNTASGPPTRLRLSWYDDPPAIGPGDCLRLKVKLEAPHGSANPGTFDYEAWLWRQGIDATGYVKQAKACDRPPAHAWLDRARATAARRIGEVLEDLPMRGIVEALTLGVRERISDDQWAVLRATGTSHLVAISGLHIGMIAALLYLVARWLAVRLGRSLPVVAIAAVTAGMGALSYALLAGFALPTQRALVMVMAGLFAVASMRRIEPSRVLALAAIVVVLWSPSAVIAPGFWLSFGAVGWLIYLGRGVQRRGWQLFIVLQLGLVAGLMPFTLWFFGQASLVAPVVNALLIPAAAIVVPALLLSVMLTLAAPVAGGPLLWTVTKALGWAWPLLVWVADLPLVSVERALPGVAALALALLAVAIMVMPRGLPGRWLAIVLFLPALIGWRPSGVEIGPGGYRLTVLDVGQGLATVVRTQRHTLIFDTGPAYRTGFNAGEAFMVPYLRHIRRAAVDALVVSHGDNDHMGGARAIAESVPITARQGAGSHHPCRADQTWRWDGVEFRFLYPDADQALAATASNERSCVLRIAGPGGVTLLTGDIETSAEQVLLERVPKALSADVLVVAHHGSASSSSSAFVRRVAPTYALISSGWHNRWGFPAPSVIARFEHVGALLANTATDGALMVSLPADGGAIGLTRWREARRRFWQVP